VADARSAAGVGPADTTGLGPHLAALTAPGAEFALVEREIDGVPMRLYARGPHTLREMILATAGFGERPYSVYRGERRSYAEHLRQTLALAALFTGRFALAPGDRVAIAMRNYPEWSPAFWATQVTGLVATPLNAWWGAAELAWAVQDSGARVVVADAERADALARTGVPIIRVRAGGPAAALNWSELGLDEPAPHDPPGVPVAPTDLSTIVYTSGTTGRPKGAAHTHLNHVTNALNVLLLTRAVARERGQPGPPTTQPGTLLTYPLFHVAGLNSLYGAALTGAKLATQYRWDPDEAVTLIREEQLTTAAGVPTTMAELAEAAIAHRAQTPSLTRIAMGGAPIPPGLVTRIGAELGPNTFAANGYGATETTSAVCANTAADYLHNPDSVGRPAPGADLRVVDPETLADVPPGQVGELWFRGPNIVRGYWNDPEATRRAIVDGWYRTGDLGRQQDGWVYVVDRIKDVVIRGGENVYSSQVEAALEELDWVVEAAVYGRPHPAMGEEVCAAVRTTASAPRDAETLARHVAHRVASFAAPTHVVWLDDPLPRTATGKIVKTRLRGQA
jgi:acyl-CoA synthetase (AMP-forming)/AMP-acid ligase II